MNVKLTWIGFKGLKFTVKYDAAGVQIYHTVAEKKIVSVLLLASFTKQVRVPILSRKRDFIHMQIKLTVI